MHVPTFTALSAVEQCEQLENYLKELKPELSFTAVDRLMLSANLREVIGALDVVLGQSGKEAEVESVLNSVVTLLFELPFSQDETKSLIGTFSQNLADSTNDKLAAVSLRVVKNLHDGLFESKDLQYVTYCAMIKLATKTKNLAEVMTSLEGIKSKYNVKTIGLERTQALYRLLSTCATECGEIDLASAIDKELTSTYAKDKATPAVSRRRQATRHLVIQSPTDHIFSPCSQRLLHKKRTEPPKEY